MKLRFLLLLVCVVLAKAEFRSGRVRFFTQDEVGPLDMGRMAVGQGGLSEEPMWAQRAAEIRALHPRLVRLFIQEYFDLLPAKGQYHFTTLDRSVDLILQTGARPLMNIDFKPRVLYPKVDQDIVEPNDWDEWERLVAALVTHYRERGSGIQYWEIANEPDIGESGGCPYRFTPSNYLPYYKHTAEAILKGDPNAKVGGPALANWKSPILPAFLDFCNSREAPVHFVSWHLYNSSPAALRDTVISVRRLLAERANLRVETILDEWNMALMRPDEQNIAFQPAFIVDTIWNFLDAGLDYSCYYHIRDYHVQPEVFARFLSARGTVNMANWWNRMPQYDGLFDFQNETRPAYFAFKLLSRLSGQRLRTESEGVRALAAYGPSYGQRSILVWNFSPDIVQTVVEFKNLTKPVAVNHIRLDAHSPASDEAVRLRFDPEQRVDPADARRETILEPYGVELWFFADP